MPTSLADGIRSRELMEALSSDDSITYVQSTQIKDPSLCRARLIGCVSCTPPGSTNIDPTFKCDLDIGDVSYVIDSIVHTNDPQNKCKYIYRGFCDVSFTNGWEFLESDHTDEYQFVNNDKSVIRFKVETSSALEAPLPNTISTHCKRYLGIIRPNGYLMPVIARIDKKKNLSVPPIAHMRLAIENRATVAPNESIWKKQLITEPLPSQGEAPHMFIFEMEIHGTKIPSLSST